jgi:predicted metal-binding membrane protein
MRTPGQTRPGAAVSFLCMWVVMMVAMMLPSLLTMLAEAAGARAGEPKRKCAPRTARQAEQIR